MSDYTIDTDAIFDDIDIQIMWLNIMTDKLIEQTQELHDDIDNYTSNLYID